MKMKKGAVAAALTVACMAAVLASFAGNARATDDEDETTYKFRLVNHQARAQSAYIRCGSSGSWTELAAGSTDKDCSESSAQTKIGTGGATSWSHDCPDGYPVMRIKYSGYWVGSSYRTQLAEMCLAS